VTGDEKSPDRSVDFKIKISSLCVITLFNVTFLMPSECFQVYFSIKSGIFVGVCRSETSSLMM